MGGTAVPFITFFPVVLFSSWYGGFRAGTLSIVLSTLAADYYFLPPVRSFLIPAPADRVSLLIFMMVSLGIALLGHSQRRAVERAGREAAQRKEAENAERDQRQRFETTLASIGDAVISTDSKGLIVFANAIALSLMRWPEAEIRGKHLDDVFQVVNEHTRAAVESLVTKVLREGTVVGLANHTVLIARDGTAVPIDDSAAPIRAENGTILGTVLVFRDVTSRRRAEESSRLLASIVESSEDAIISRDLNGVITSWNRGAERMFEHTAAEAIGQPISIVAVPGHDEMGVMERIRQGQRIDQYETLRQTRSGRLVNVSVTESPILDALGRVIGASKIARDVTERKQSEERFWLAVEAAPNGMVITNEAGEVILVNSQVETLFGYSREEIIGQPVEILVPLRLRGEHPQFRQSFNANPRTRLMGEGRDLHGRRKDGSEFPVEIGLNPIETSHGRWVLSAIVDITERKRIEQERLDILAKERSLASERAAREAEAELARVVRALTLGELAASIAHEVNQPLAAVITNAEACRRWIAGESPNLREAQESLALIVRDGNRASEIIRRIREFLKKDALVAESLDINEAVQEAVSFARGEIVKSNVSLRLELSSGLPPVWGDRIQLQQVILNLIMNGREAVEAVTDRPRELMVTSRKLADDGVAVAVRDFGVGIKPEDVDRIFDAFFTTKPMGIGMGLSISRSIIEAHGGRIWAELNHGPGLTVQFNLPARTETS